MTQSASCTLTPVVAVPARNEETRLPILVEALANQTWLRVGRTLTVVIVLNNCTDGSAEALEALKHRYSRLDLQIIDVLLEAPHDHVGTARKIAMDAAVARVVGRPIALLTTDADATPDAHWIEANLAALDAGADIVGGHIVGDPIEEARLGPGFRRRVDRHLHYAQLADRLAAMIDPLPHDPLPRHGDHTGASLAVRGEVYEVLGGLPALPFREDVAFVVRARAAGYRLRHAPEVRVKVSARLVGRAPGGMADCLKTWVREEAEALPHLVESIDRLRDRLYLRRALRTGAVPDALSTTAPASPWLDGWAGLDLQSLTAQVELRAGEALDLRGDTPVDHAVLALETLLREAEAYDDAA